MSEPLDYLIIGQGLAGSLLGWELLHLGARVHLVEAKLPNSAHPVAAGILNPVTGKRIVKSWNIDELLPTAKETYRTLEKAFGEAFFEERGILRIFRDREEKTLWETRKADPEYAQWLGDAFDPGAFGEELQDPHGSFEIRGGGWLSVSELVVKLAEYFERREVLIRVPFRYEELDLESDPECCRWKDYSARVVIFCEGFRATRNPWFNWLDYRLSKGEVLDVDQCLAVTDYILNKGKWILPTGPKRARVGATYSWDSLESGPSLTGMMELVKDLKTLNAGKFPVSSHRAGIRPGTNDSLPYVGRHPLEPRLAILNGFGSKGSIYGPATAQDLASHLQRDSEIREDWDIRRRLKFLDQPLELP